MQYDTIQCDVTQYDRMLIHFIVPWEKFVLDSSGDPISCPYSENQ